MELQADQYQTPPPEETPGVTIMEGGSSEEMPMRTLARQDKREKTNNYQNEELGLFTIKRFAFYDYETMWNGRTKKTQIETKKQSQYSTIPF